MTDLLELSLNSGFARMTTTTRIKEGSADYATARDHEATQGRTKILIGYTARWRQRRKPDKRNPSEWSEPVTGRAIFNNLDHVIELCRKVNRFEGIQQWPVKWELVKSSVKSKELEDLRHQMGFDS